LKERFVIAHSLSLASRYGKPIRTMEEWRVERKALNRGWVEGKSAWEIANAWVGSGKPLVPTGFQRLLESHTMTTGVVVHDGVVERKTSLLYAPSGPRNHDLALWARENSPRVFIGIESKADDGFGKTMKEQIDLANQKRGQGENTNLDRRMDWLSHCLLGVTLLASDDQNASRCQQEQEIRTKVLDLPFQLFAGVAGTLLEAKKARSEIAIFVVHQFRTPHTNDNEIKADARALHRFVSLLVQTNPGPNDLPRSRVPFHCGNLVDPIYIEKRNCGQEEKWTMPTEIPLLIGAFHTDRTRQLS
jgi:hypothetical protein